MRKVIKKEGSGTKRIIIKVKKNVIKSIRYIIKNLVIFFHFYRALFEFLCLIMFGKFFFSFLFFYYIAGNFNI